VELNLWTRVVMLRRLVKFFESIDVTSQFALERWARSAQFERDFQGKVSGLSYAAFKWLVIRQGVETIKPDAHVQTSSKEPSDAGLATEGPCQSLSPSLRTWVSMRRNSILGFGISSAVAAMLKTPKATSSDQCKGESNNKSNRK
jgi:hypothetical protein